LNGTDYCPSTMGISLRFYRDLQEDEKSSFIG